MYLFCFVLFVLFCFVLFAHICAYSMCMCVHWHFNQCIYIVCLLYLFKIMDFYSFFLTQASQQTTCFHTRTHTHTQANMSQNNKHKIFFCNHFFYFKSKQANKPVFTFSFLITFSHLIILVF